MGLITSTYRYFLDHPAEFADKVATHLSLSGEALCIAAACAFPLGVIAARNRIAALLATNLVGAARSIPSLAIMALMLPFIGIGYTPALVALTVLAIPPVFLNTLAGFNSVNPAAVEAARGMGMNNWQIMREIEIPLALPVLVAGVRTASVEVLASATLGAIIGAGGLGEYIFSGLSLGRSYTHLMIIGAVPIAVLALVADTVLYRVERGTLRRSTGDSAPALRRHSSN